jgi:DNA-binding IclR family transcriptional regulator
LHIWSDIPLMATISQGDPSAQKSRAEADPSFATTLAHGLDVLAAFRNSFGSLSNADLAARTGLSRPTVSRLTYTLAQLGYLKRDAKGRFELGLGVLATAYPLLSAIKVRQMARPLMRDFAAYAGGTVSIAMPFGLDFIYVETLRTTDAVPHVPDVGFTGTMATTAVGRALLSLFTAEELTSHLARVKAERPEEADYVERRTLPDMALCRERGFAVSLGEWRREIFGVAAPLYRTATGDCLSVNCGIPSFRFSAEQIERECGPRILGLARSIRSLAANGRQSPT